jgi:hypothetical protein
LTRPLVRESRIAGLRGFDAGGAATITSSLGLLVYAISKAPDVGWGSGKTIGELAGAAVLLAAFIVIELRQRSPMMPFSIFRVRTVTGANICGFFLGAVVFANFFLLTLYVQQVLHYSALKTGLSYLPLTGMLTAFAFVAPALIPRMGIRLVIFLGSTVATAGLALFAFSTPDGGLFRDVILPSLIVSPGLALTFIPMNMAAMTNVKPQDMGFAAGMSNVSRTLGGALGLEVIATLASTRTDTRIAAGHGVINSTSDGFTLGFGLCACFMAAAAIACVLLPGRQGETVASD